MTVGIYKWDLGVHTQFCNEFTPVISLVELTFTAVVWLLSAFISFRSSMPATHDDTSRVLCFPATGMSADKGLQREIRLNI